jgi:DNA-binding HxlR family transcriptional regulator
MPRRSYAQYCAVARSLDVVGERWTLLVVRELALGPRRYTDLHADLPGISTDVLAARLKELEADGIVVRRQVAHSWMYDLTPRGTELIPVLTALATWGTALLDTQRTTDALRSHWYVLPLAALLHATARGTTGIVDLRVDSTQQLIELTPQRPVVVDTPTPADATLALPATVAEAILTTETTLAEALATGNATLSGSGDLAEALSSAGSVRE